jgi:cytochrome c oxidase subunit 3
MELVNTQQRQKIHPHKLAMWIAIGSLIMMFAGMTSAFIVKSNQPGWKDVEVPQVFWYSTAVILASSLTVQMALRSFKQRELSQYRMLIAVTFILGALFVFLQWVGFNNLWDQGIRLKGSGAAQFLYVIFGLHGVHVIGGIVALLVMFIKAFFGKTKSYNSIPVEVAATYWHFVDLLWVYLFVFFMWIK